MQRNGTRRSENRFEPRVCATAEEVSPSRSNGAGLGGGEKEALDKEGCH
jgi:hypothetical protein